MLQLRQRPWRICPAWYLQMPACLFISSTWEWLLRMRFLLPSSQHTWEGQSGPTSTGVFTQSLSWWHTWGCGAMIPAQLRLESLMLSKPEALDAAGVRDFCSELCAPWWDREATVKPPAPQWKGFYTLCCSGGDGCQLCTIHFQAQEQHKLV